MMGIMVPETCWASNKICNKTHLLHIVGILFPHINDDAGSKSLQIWIQEVFRRTESLVFWGNTWGGCFIWLGELHAVPNKYITALSQDSNADHCYYTAGYSALSGLPHVIATLAASYSNASHKSNAFHFYSNTDPFPIKDDGKSHLSSFALSFLQYSLHVPIIWQS